MSKTEVIQIPVGPMRNFDYLLIDRESREALAVDSGWETGPVVDAARRGDLRVKYVVATHGHFDHVETLRDLAKLLGAQVVVHESSELEADLRVADGAVLNLGNTRVRVIHTPGHTPDSVCLYDGEEVFTGDTLFIGNCGRTDLPGGSAQQLFHSLRDILMKLPPGTVVYPGHDYGDVPCKSIGEEARTNPALLARNVEEFMGVE